ncbi:hypothetical protein ACFVIN_35860, partial [Streptomyces prasinus]
AARPPTPTRRVSPAAPCRPRAASRRNLPPPPRGRLGGDVEEGIDHSAMDHGGGAHPSDGAGKEEGGHSGHSGHGG